MGSRTLHVGCRPCSGSAGPTKAPLHSRWDVGLWVLGISTGPRPPGRPHRRQACGPLSTGSSAQGVLGSRGGLSRAGARPVKSLGFRGGHYRARQLVHLHGLYLKVAGRLKIAGFAGQDLCVPFGFPGNAGLWPASIPADAGQAGQGCGSLGPAARSITPSPWAPSALAWAGHGA